MSNCKYLKKKLNGNLECKYKCKRITLRDCNYCTFKEYKILSAVNSQKQRSAKMSAKPLQKNKKIAKLERDRFSIITNDLEHCINCGKPKEHLHEIFFGKNRLNSMRYGLVIPLCFECHQKIHNDIKLDGYYKRLGQQRFNEVYPDNDFVEIFKKDYL